MAPYSAILPPKSLGDALRPLLQLSDADFGAVVQAVSGARSFSITKEELESLRGKIPLHAANITFLVASLNFIYSHLSRLVDAGMPYAEAIGATVDELDAEEKWGSEK